MVLSIILIGVLVTIGGWWLWRLLKEKEKKDEKKKIAF